MRKYLGILAMAGLVTFGAGAATNSASAQGLDVRVGVGGYRSARSRRSGPLRASRALQSRLLRRAPTCTTARRCVPFAALRCASTCVRTECWCVDRLRFAAARSQAATKTSVVRKEGRGANTPRPFSCKAYRLSAEGADIHEPSGNGGRRRHRRRHQMGAALEALTPFEIAVRRGRAALAGLRAGRRSSPGTWSSRARAIRSLRP